MKKTLSLLLTLLIILSVLPVQAFAAGPSATIQALLNAEPLTPQKSGYLPVDRKIEEILATSPDNSTASRFRTCYDWLVKNVSYGLAPTCTYVYTVNEIAHYSAEPYQIFQANGTLLEGMGVCDGYASALALMARAIGLTAAYHGVSGHAYTVVRLGGQWYKFDAQVDDLGTRTNYSYYGVKDRTVDSETALDAYADLSIDSTKLSNSPNYEDYMFQIFYILPLNGFEGQDEKFERMERYPYDDIPDNAWYSSAALFTYYAGFLRPYGGGWVSLRFGADEAATRAELVYPLGLLCGGVSYFDNTSAFTDVAPSAFYCSSVAWATHDHVINGYGDGRFGPEDPLTREQLATILYNYCVLASIQFQTSTGLTLADFPDSNSISSYARDGMNWAVTYGILKGDEKGQLLPQKGLTRAELAQALTNFISMYVAT